MVESTLDKIIEGAKTASEAIGVAGDELLGNIAAANSSGVAGTDVEKLVKGIKGVVEVVLEKEGNAEAGDDKKAEDGNTARNNDGAGKLFDGTTGSGADDKKSATDASKAVGAVTGADILKAMVRDSGNAAKLAKHSAAIAAANVNAPKDAEVAGGIALRAIAKNGKFANGNNANDAKKMIERAILSVVTKALDTLTVAIRKTIDLGLKEVKKVIKISNDIPLASEKSGSGGQN